MSVAAETIYEVFLSHGRRDRGIADYVLESLAAAGLEAFTIDRVENDSEFLADVRRALAECSAVILLLTRSTLNSQNTAFEIGMALAWNKPIYVLFDGVDKSEIPQFLCEFQLRPLSSLHSVVKEIAAARRPLSDEARDDLIAVYCELKLPTDRLLRKPLELRELAERFEQRTGTRVAGERLAQELMRLRKQGRLPRLQHE